MHIDRVAHVMRWSRVRDTRTTAMVNVAVSRQAERCPAYVLYIFSAHSSKRWAAACDIIIRLATVIGARRFGACACYGLGLGMDSQSAFTEWYKAQPDERFPTLDLLQDAVDRASRESYEPEEVIRTRKLSVMPSDDQRSLVLVGEGIPDDARLNRHAFGQFAKRILPPGITPDAVLGMHPQLGAQVLNSHITGITLEGVTPLGQGTDALWTPPADGLIMPYIRKAGEFGNPEVRAITSEQYARVKDSTVLRMCRNAINGAAAYGIELGPLPSWNEASDSLFYGERGLSILVAEAEATIVGGRAKERKLHLMLWAKNNEVGAGRFEFFLCLVDEICGNLQLFGLKQLIGISLVHRGNRQALQAKIHEAFDDLPAALGENARQFVTDAAEQIKIACGIPIHDKVNLTADPQDEDTRDLIAGRIAKVASVPKQVAARAVTMAWKEGEDPRYVEGAFQGFSALARDAKTAQETETLSRYGGVLLNTMIESNRGSDAKTIGAL